MLVVHRWPSLIGFRAFMDSDAYRPWRDLRRTSAESNHAVVEAYPTTR